MLTIKFTSTAECVLCDKIAITPPRSDGVVRLKFVRKQKKCIRSSLVWQSMICIVSV